MLWKNSQTKWQSWVEDSKKNAWAQKDSAVRLNLQKTFNFQTWLCASWGELANAFSSSISKDMFNQFTSIRMKRKSSYWLIVVPFSSLELHGIFCLNISWLRFCGIFLSDTHFCLNLTKQQQNSSTRIFLPQNTVKIILLAIVVIFLVHLLVFLLMNTLR